MDGDRGRSYGCRGAMSRASAGLGLGMLALVSGAVALVLTGVVPAAASAQQAASATSLVLDRVTVVDVEQGKLVPDQRVVIAGNRIQAVGNVGAVELPKGAQAVEAQGKYLIPGLWDLHIHMRRPDLVGPLLLANGVTGIRNAAAEAPFDTLLQRRREILAGVRVGPPRQILSGPAISEAGNNGTPNPCVRRTHWQVCVTPDPADVQHLVDSFKTVGAEMIKTYDLSQEMYYAVAAAARRAGIPFGGHLEDGQLTSLEASDSGASILDHMAQSRLVPFCFDGDVEQCQPVAERFRRNNTWWVPTLIFTRWGGGVGGYCSSEVYEGLLTRLDELLQDFWSDSVAQRTGNWLQGAASISPADSPGCLRVMQRAGLPILAGTDAGMSPKALLPGFALHAELAIYAAEGLTPLGALQTATLNPAKLLHATDSLGTVAPGKLADLVLLDADPLADITNTTTIRAVVANGRYFDRAALDSLLAKVRAKADEADKEP